MVKKKQLEISISRKVFYSLIAVGVIMLLGVGVFAFNTGFSPDVLGHSAEEIDLSGGVNTDAVFNQNIQVLGEINSAGDVCISGGNCLSSVGGGAEGIVNVYQCPAYPDTCYGRTRVWPNGCNGQLKTGTSGATCVHGNCGNSVSDCTYVGKLVA